MKPALLVLLLAGCATPTALQPTVDMTHRVEDRALPPDPAQEKLDATIPAGDWIEPLEAASCLDKAGKPVTGVYPCPLRSGLALSEARAFRDGLFRVRYPELRRLYEADQQVWKAHRELYEERLKLADTEIKRLQPNWFERNAFALGMIGGFLVGTGMTLGVMYVVVPAFNK